MQYMVKDFGLTYSNGAFIENVGDTRERQRLVCPCSPRIPYEFKLREKARLHVFSESEAEKTHYSLTPRKRLTDAPAHAS
jgi:hypothetical protein